MAYGTDAGADAYHLERGNADWAMGTQSERTAARIRASQYIDGRYRLEVSPGIWISMFSGKRTGARAQADEWPRTGATDIDGNAIPEAEVPIEVLNATYEAASRELAEAGSLSPDYTASQQVTKEKVDVLEVTYADTSSDGGGLTQGPPNMPSVPAIDFIIAPVLGLGGSNPYGLTWYVV